MKFPHRWGAAGSLAALALFSIGSDAHARVCGLEIHLDDDVELGSLQLAIGHQGGTFRDPACTTTVAGALAAYGADAGAGRLDASYVSVNGFGGPAKLSDCRLDDAAGDVSLADFTALVVEATQVGGAPVESLPSVSLSLDCDVETGTTTTTEDTRSCEITFGLGAAGLVASLDWRVDYSDAPGSFAGSGSGVECTNLLQVGTLASFRDNDNVSTLRGAMIHNVGVATPDDIARCRFLPVGDDPVAADFDGVVTNATDAAEVQAKPTPTLTVTGIDCSGIPVDSICGDGDVEGNEECDDSNVEDGDGCSSQCEEEAGGGALCGDANESGTVTATDALRILEAALTGGAGCPAWLCDTDSSGSILANDALRALRKAIGLDVDIHCPDKD